VARCTSIRKEGTVGTATCGRMGEKRKGSDPFAGGVFLWSDAKREGDGLIDGGGGDEVCFDANEKGGGLGRRRYR